MKKHALRKRNKRQKALIQSLREINGTLRREFTVVDGNSRHWRAKYEDAMSSPEIKADTEAAFKRGQDSMRQSCAAFLYQTVLTMEAEQ